MEYLENRINEIDTKFPYITEIINEISRIDKISNMDFDYDIERKHMKYVEIYDIFKKYN